MIIEKIMSANTILCPAFYSVVSHGDKKSVLGSLSFLVFSLSDLE